SSGKYRVSGRSLREPSSISSPSRKTTHRKPSHLGSYSRPGSRGTACTAFASIGRTGGITGRSTPAILNDRSDNSGRDTHCLVTTERPEPPLTGGERETLRTFLDFHRATLAMKCDGLSDEDL